MLYIRTAAPFVALAVVAAFVACADGSGDVTDDTSGTDPDSGSGLVDQPIDSGPAATTTASNGTDAGSADDAGQLTDGATASDAATATDASTPPKTNGYLCPTTGVTGILYGSEYDSISDPTTVPCPCTSKQCCYDPGPSPLPGIIARLPNACVTR